eukprot:TRINITY_DN7773_c0_g1_i1.p1 TRINITY_DN7773_c0_g1~~TRINITY_DN7773_c0_g1_i1.p1  ORF type:complete len:183 (+),score=39.81 TRINITY_DN7773_c0_g1_i1:3-551(+)
MKFFVLSLFIILASATSDEETPYRFLTSKVKSLVLFNSRYCNSCLQFSTVWESVVNQIKSDGLSVDVHFIECAGSDIDKPTAKCRESFKVQSYPTVRLYLDGKEITYYGERKLESIIEWIKTTTPTQDAVYIENPEAEEAIPVPKHKMSFSDYEGKEGIYIFEDDYQKFVESIREGTWLIKV